MSRQSKVLIGLLVALSWILARGIPVWFLHSTMIWQIIAVFIFCMYLSIGLVLNQQIHAHYIVYDADIFKARNINQKAKTKLTIKSTIVLSIGILLMLSLIISCFGIAKQKYTIKTLIYAVLIAPMLEELVYREFIFNYLSNFNLLFAFVFESLLFTTVHLPNSLLGSLYDLIGAVILTYVYYRSHRNVYASWTVHITNNIFNLLLPLIL